jgi:hypothetical protein
MAARRPATPTDSCHACPLPLPPPSRTTPKLHLFDGPTPTQAPTLSRHARAMICWSCTTPRKQPDDRTAQKGILTRVVAYSGEKWCAAADEEGHYVFAVAL